MNSTRIRTPAGCARVLLLAMVLAGCSGPSSSTPAPPGRPAPPTAPVPVPPACPAPPPSAGPLDLMFGNTGPAGTVPAGFAPVAALRCRLSGATRPGSGNRVVMVEERTTTGLDELLDALRMPWATAYSPVCPASVVAVPYVVLIDADGSAIRPALPRDGCGQPRAEVLAVLTALPWKVTGEQPG